MLEFMKYETCGYYYHKRMIFVNIMTVVWGEIFVVNEIEIKMWYIWGTKLLTLSLRFGTVHTYGIVHRVLFMAQHHQIFSRVACSDMRKLCSCMVLFTWHCSHARIVRKLWEWIRKLYFKRCYGQMILLVQEIFWSQFGVLWLNGISWYTMEAQFSVNLIRL